jgi:hypothetical protein
MNNSMESWTDKDWEKLDSEAEELRKRDKLNRENKRDFKNEFLGRGRGRKERSYRDIARG